jgi:hypothetical protein
MQNPYDRFSKLPDGRVLDSEPMKAGDPLLVFDKTSDTWMDFEGTLGEWRHSIAITAEEATRLTSGAAQSQSQSNPHNGQAKK